MSIQSIKPLAAMFACAALASLTGASDGFAKPKTAKSLGCTMQQLIKAANDTPAGRECSRLQDQSVINNTTFIAFVCTSSGIYCCPENAASASDCTQVSASRVPNRAPLSDAIKTGLAR
ncbi:MAG: hypothetical protein WCC66_08760 [Rhizobiaceae bacterium]